MAHFLQGNNQIKQSIMNSIELVDKFVQARKAEDEKYGDSAALGALKAMMSSAIDVIDKIVKAYDHEDPLQHLRYPIMDCKIFLKYMEEKANV